MKLTGTQIRHLRGLAHHKRTTVTVGQSGITKSVIKELDLALVAHELIKIRINAANNEARQEMIEQILEEHDATLVNQIGHIAVIYRNKEDH